jgi:hypothetical protein
MNLFHIKFEKRISLLLTHTNHQNKLTLLIYLLVPVSIKEFFSEQLRKQSFQISAKFLDLFTIRNEIEIHQLPQVILNFKAVFLLIVYKTSLLYTCVVIVTLMSSQCGKIFMSQNSVCLFVCLFVSLFGCSSVCLFILILERLFLPQAKHLLNYLIKL